MTELPTWLVLALGLAPVLCFLLILVSLDSYKLVPLWRVLVLLAGGAVSAGVAYVANRSLAIHFGLDATTLARYVAPVIEESLKGAIVVYLIAGRRVGFLVDAAIAAFAVGAGFAAVENIHYMLVLGDPRIAVWLVRGFGTAIMHGGATASFAIASKAFADRRGGARPEVFLPGWVLAIVIHSGFNHFLLAPDLATLGLLVTLPLLFFVVFRISEAQTRRWLGTGFDTDAELLDLIGAGHFGETRIGAYLQSLTRSFPPTTVADMLCLLRLRLELSIRAKGILILKNAGAEPKPDPEIGEKFAELRYLERSIGRTGLGALRPILHFSDQDLWQYHMLGGK